MHVLSNLHSVYQIIEGYEKPIHLFEAGDPEKETLFLLHGYMAHGLMFSRIIELLADDYHLIIPELPAHGLDESFRDGGLNTTIESNIEWLRRVVSLYNPEHIVGHSFGASLVYEVAKTFDFQNVILVGPGLHIPSKKIEGILAKRIPIRVAKLISRRSIFRIFEKLQWEGLKMSKHEVARYVKPFRDTERLRYMVRLGTDLLAHSSEDRLLSPLKMNTKIIWGHKDVVIPVRLSEGVSKALNAELEIIENSGHSPPEDTPEIFVAILKNFIKKKV